ncbi:hypothetical protein MGYG_03935 [Nannizzia gypsea CBS 118893]|uniref:Uncharacterized protein n=1 Tax=Arthroderma gypseum (strain ATCC MYA-4604 / CBS 118893) TaxID=535722 RepID=E4UUG7_ARTGP|nr:hypothetical protein MGYG_03935 [Nannizzia gypsea CBS 118893]EFR00934.1 hypothetical protein MGYG_03935 [Nannizzia gypsea CBS 118893]
MGWDAMRCDGDRDGDWDGDGMGDGCEAGGRSLAWRDRPWPWILGGTGKYGVARWQLRDKEKCWMLDGYWLIRKTTTTTTTTTTKVGGGLEVG